MLHETPAVNFRGNIEGHDLFKGEINVAVCDGFVGNVILKTSESVAHAVGHWIKQEFRSNPVRLLGTALLSGALRNLRTNMNPEMYGGAPLLGVNGVCTISHGASSPRAIFHAIRVTRDSVKLNLNEHIIRTVGEVMYRKPDNNTRSDLPTVALVATGSYLPEKILTNADLQKMVDTSDDGSPPVLALRAPYCRR